MGTDDKPPAGAQHALNFRMNRACSRTCSNSVSKDTTAPTEASRSGKSSALPWTPRPHRRPPVDADGSHRFRNAPFGRDVVQAPGGASGLSHDETRCAAFAGAGASSASATCRFRESIPHPVQPLSTLRTPRCRDARKTRSRPACSALNGPDLHWQAHSSLPLAPRIRLFQEVTRTKPLIPAPCGVPFYRLDPAMPAGSRRGAQRHHGKERDLGP